MKQYRTYTEGQYSYLKNTSDNLRTRTGQRGSQFVEDNELTVLGFLGVEDTDWANLRTHVGVVPTGLRVREGVREEDYVVDIELTATGFAGVEDTDWQNVYSSWQNYWTPQSAAVENAEPTHLVLTYSKNPKPAEMIADNFAVSGNTVSSISGSGKVYTIVLGAAALYGQALVLIAHGENINITNNVAAETEALAYFARMSVAPSDAIKFAINDYIKESKAEGIYSEGDAEYIFATHDQQSSLLNVIENDHNASVQGGLSQTQYMGYTGDGIAKYLKTDFIPGTDGVKHTTNDSGVFVWISGNQSVAKEFIGAYCHETPQWKATQLYHSAASVLGIVNGLDIGNGVTVDNFFTPFANNNNPSDGFWGITRDATKLYLWYNGVKIAEANWAHTYAITNELFILASNSYAGTPIDLSPATIRKAWIGSGLTEAKIAKKYLIDAKLLSRI